jgi:hypothetical protein
MQVSASSISPSIAASIAASSADSDLRLEGPLFPLVFAMWQSDATVRVALEQSVQASVTPFGAGALVPGGEAAFEASTFDPRSAYGIRARGLYGLVLSLPGSGNTAEPAHNLSAEASADAGYQITPRLRLTLDTQSYLANRFGVRATDELAARDPFLEGSRLEYTIGAGPGLYATTSRRSTVRASFGYAQAGALAASSQDAVGVDTHTARGSLAEGYDLGPNDTITPELRYTFTHFYHALYGVGQGSAPAVPAGMGQGAASTASSGTDQGSASVAPSDIALVRGPADIHTATALVGETHTFGRRLLATASFGMTVATPPPMLHSTAPVFAPEAHLSMSHFAQRSRITATYSYAYTSLGPRIGFGSQHNGTLEMSLRPVRGAKYRDFMLHGIGRAAFGSAPVAANPELGPGPPPEGTLSTTTAAAGARVEYPLRRGLVMLGGFDLQFTHGVFDPEPAAGSPAPRLVMIATLGIAGTFSTDPNRTVLRDPDDEEDDARRKQRGEPASTERREDQTRSYPGEDHDRQDDRDKVDRDWQVDPAELQRPPDEGGAPP